MLLQPCGSPGARSLRERQRARRKIQSSRDIMTVVPRGWCSGETFYLGLALHRPASWEAGLVRCGLISTTRAGVESLPREPRSYEAPAQQGC